MALRTAMNSPFLKCVGVVTQMLAMMLALMLPFLAAAQDSEVKARIAFGVQQADEFWAGQQLTLNLDLKTTGFSFSGTHFNLPEVTGAFLMQTDTTTVKFSENVAGQSWQIVRYPLALYPQKAGLLTIPPIDVRFSTSAGFGSVVEDFEFQTEPLALTIALPPGVKDGELVVTTSSFELDHDWQGANGDAQTGDALTLTVKRRANDISAMLLPPLPVYRTRGLAAYPQEPELNDRTNRGSLTGERIDSITWVVETPGSYAIPGIRFQWWDPHSHNLKRQVIPGLKLDVPRPPEDQPRSKASDTPEQADNNSILLLSIVMMMLIAASTWLYFVRRSPGQHLETEKSTFATVQKACKANHAGQAYAAIHIWLGWASASVSAGSKPVTLREFAQAHNDKKLAAELERLQAALITPASTWQGSGLLGLLQDLRSKINNHRAVQAKIHLAPLNPDISPRRTVNW